MAALYVDPRGVYADLPGVDVWDEERDARLYAGPWPVVAHPPCGRWSRLAGLVEKRYGHRVGEDGGCFEAALASVRTYGGVLEHPAYTKAWAHFGLPRPVVTAGWTVTTDGRHASCYIEQGAYGHPEAKPTWLYAYGVELPQLRWSTTWLDRYATGYIPRTTKGEQGWASRRGGKRGPMGTDAATPIAFRDLLLAMARSVYASGRVAA